MPDDLSLTDAHIAGLPVKECGEPLVDLRRIPALRVGPDAGGAWLRSSLVDRLVTAQCLLPRGTRLLIVDGYRTAARQRRHFADACTTLRIAHRDGPDRQGRATARRDCQPADTAPHRTGAAVDLTLYPTCGPDPDMGAWEYTDLALEPPPARVLANRRMLAQVLIAVGLVNRPTAWWHWSYGDQYWCHLTRAD